MAADGLTPDWMRWTICDIMSASNTNSSIVTQVPNVTGAINTSSIAKTSRQVPVVLPASVSLMGSNQASESSIMFPGTRFYVLAASSPLTIRTVRGGSSSAANVFGIAQGAPVKDGFDGIIVSNPNPFPVVGLVWVGFDDFVNNQLTLVSSSYQQIAYPTQPSASFAGPIIQIPDLTGQTFTDVNGNKYGAVQRVAILVFNTSTGVTLSLQKAQSSPGSATANAVGLIGPGLPVRFDFGGNYSISIGGAAVPAIVSEIYNAFPTT
jgi:hypothetical protein